MLGFARVCHGLQGYTRVYKGILGVTRVCLSLQGYVMAYKGIQGYKRFSTGIF